METLHQTPRRTRGEYGPLDEPPAEILAEIQEGLDAIYLRDSHTEYRLEAGLTPEQAELAVLYYLTRDVEEGDSYRGRHQGSAEKQGIINPISMELGIGHEAIRSALDSLAERNVIGIETKAWHRFMIITDVHVTPATTATMADYESGHPEDMNVIQRHFMRYMRETVLFVRKEIDRAREELGLEPADGYEDLSSFQTLDDLDEHLSQLRTTQNEHLSMLDSSFH